MIKLEQVEELRKRANISYEEAKKALEEANGDILEAIINLEKQNKIKPPAGGGYYSTKDEIKEVNQFQDSEANRKHKEDISISIKDLFKQVGSFIVKAIDKGNRNFFEVFKNGKKVMALPVTILVLLAIFAFWVVFPLLIVGLFFGFKYRFSGPDLEREDINGAMNSMAGVVENIKKEVKGDNSNGEDSNN
ncbi:MAG: DUF4342 domain-containing protein [Tissierellia bacterium]|nr:DUF4342 domain-containing protein [Tissierellia bacterium]